MNESKPVVAMLGALPRDVQDRLARDYRLIVAYNDAAETVKASPLAGEARAAVIVSGANMDKRMVDLLPRLELVCCYGAGYEQADTAALKARGILLANAGGANAPCVADMAVTLLLASTLRLLPADRLVREGQWTRTPPKGWKLSSGFGGRKLGIFGLGAIGLNVARRMAGFDLEIGYHNRRPRQDGAAYRYFADLKAMAEWCDYLVVACPLTDQTHHAVSDEVLRALGPAGYVVNVGRGAIIDQQALIAALRDNVIAGAGLDVAEGEPGVPPELAQLPNVVLTPHIGAVTQRAFESLNQRLYDNLAAHFAGKPPLSPVPL